MTPPIDRREFGRALGLTALTATVPTFLHKTGLALAGDPRRQIEPIPGLRDNRVLVIIQLAGGNDGLNTLVPHGDDAYYRARPRISVPAERVLRINERVGLHPEMVELHRLLDDGKLAIITNVGYPNPNRSHFRSMDIWESASPANRNWPTGWIGRYFDHECDGVQSPMLGVRIGEQAARTFASERVRSTTFVTPAMLEDRASGAAARGLNQLAQVETTGIDALDFIQRTNNQTRELAQRIRQAVQNVRPAVEYPPFALCQSLRLIGQMITAGVPTRVYYVTHGGFDTHSAQNNRHPALLQELSQALGLFYRDLREQGQLDRVLTMTFSEFGRRIDENQQQGTDHGTANVMFVMGGQVRGGLIGDPPNLTNRDEQGDLIFRTDFRAVYAGVLRDWLGADPQRILQERFEPVQVIRPRA
jgi:uncharacterized protein (DUF1501 family)